MRAQEQLAASSLPASALVDGVPEPSARGIADHVTLLIDRGRIPDGTRLPTVRAVAAALHVGATTVATAWALLRQRNLIRSDGRNGTYVRNLGESAPSTASSPGAAATTSLDLVSPSYDADLVPDPAQHLAAAAQTLAWDQEESAVVDDALARDVSSTWPFVPEALALAWGFSDALAQIVSLALVPGDRVLVESACSPETAAVLAAHRAQAVPIACDDAGMLPDAVDQAMAARPSMVVLQPRMADPLAHTLTSQRAHELASVLVDRDVLVVEEDRAVALSATAEASIGTWLPDRTVLVRDYRRAYGPRIRLAVVGGAAPVIERLRARQVVLGSHPSLLGQRTLSSMLRDAGVAETITRARWRYARRWHALSRSLHRFGVPVPGNGGLTAWVPVKDADETVRRLAGMGIRVGPGTDLAGGDEGRRHVRIATSALRTGQPGLARMLASDTEMHELRKTAGE